MSEFFLSVVQMSFTASIVIVAVMLTRLLLRKAPKFFSYSLWAVVLFRLLCPFSIESAIGILPDISSQSTVATTTQRTFLDVLPVDSEYYDYTHNDYQQVDHITKSDVSPTTLSSMTLKPTMQDVILQSLPYIWLVGVVVLIACNIFMYLRLRQKLIISTRLSGNIYLADEISTPFVLGALRPKIYLPSNLTQDEQAYVIAHEKYHIKRLDHLTRIIAFVTLAIHWFNPLVWIAFIYAGKDMEMSCDEAVMNKLGSDIKVPYSTSLLKFATHKNHISATALGFGKGETKERVKNIMNYKKPVIWVVVFSIALVIALLVMFGTNSSVTNEQPPTPTTQNDQSAATNIVDDQPTDMSNSELSIDLEDHVATDIENSAEPTRSISAWDDIRGFHWSEESEYTFSKAEYNKEDLGTYNFNEYTVLEGSEEQLAQILEDGKNPGLGVRELHQQGITGMGINVAIIDQNLLLDHPEFDGKIVAYHDTGTETSDNNGSMHAPAVTSILVGDTIGVAPDANVYFAAVPTWKRDAKYYADALYWIVEQNEKLPDDQKIRVVSLSGGAKGFPDNLNPNAETWDEALVAAREAGILVMDCSMDETTSFLYPIYFDGDDRDNPTHYTLGFPDEISSASYMEDWEIGVPTSFRTVAEEYVAGSPSYYHTAAGGLSWATPYVAGVLALGWQINPELTNEQILTLLHESCAFEQNGKKIINPPEFIKMVQGTL